MSAPIMSRFDLFFILIDECNEATDLYIAQNIVNFHTNDKSIIDRARVYTAADIHKYITFARLCKPRVSPEAQEVMISEYKKLRQRESSNKSAWRITVRQLESLVRLSEAMARMHLSEEVTEDHVREAYRLLSKSIIRVEQPDIQFEDDNMAATVAQVATENLGADEMGAQQMDTDTPTAAPAPPQAPKQTIKLSYDEYKRISNMIVYYIRKKEEEIDPESETFTGVHQSELVSWYLQEMESQIESEQQLNEQKLLIEKIVNRLINYDNVIIKLDKESFKAAAATGILTATEGQTGEQPAEPEHLREETDPILVVHPNYVPDE